MGMGRKLDPTKLETCDIWETRTCPLARNTREGLRKRGFTGNFTVVYSNEPAAGENTKPIGSAVPVTAAAGLILASLVIRDVRRKVCNE